MTINKRSNDCALPTKAQRKGSKRVLKNFKFLFSVKIYNLITFQFIDVCKEQDITK